MTTAAVLTGATFLGEVKLQEEGIMGTVLGMLLCDNLSTVTEDEVVRTTLATDRRGSQGGGTITTEVEEPQIQLTITTLATTVVEQDTSALSAQVPGDNKEPIWQKRATLNQIILGGLLWLMLQPFQRI